MTFKLSVDLSNISTSPINPSQIASSPVDLSKSVENPPLRLRGGGRLTHPVKGFKELPPWGCIVIPVLQRRVKEQEVQYLVC